MSQMYQSNELGQFDLINDFLTAWILSYLRKGLHCWWLVKIFEVDGSRSPREDWSSQPTIDVGPEIPLYWQFHLGLVT